MNPVEAEIVQAGKRRKSKPTRTETITWHDDPADMPDADTTVLLDVPGADSEQVWPGFWDGEAWMYAEGAPVGQPVKAWADMPEGAR